MAGNIRGNGHYNASRINKERTEMGYEPKTIKIGNKWVSFQGIPGVEQVLTILGDISYYAKDLDEAMIANWESKLMWSLTATFLGDSPLQGMEPLVAALNGDFSGWNRLIANATRSIIPMSGALGVLNSSITSTLKDLEGEIHEFVANRLPLFSNTLPDQIDFWTGEALNDTGNVVYKWLNAVNPLKISEGAEPWRIWLSKTGWRGHSKLGMDSTGSYRYSTREREKIMEYIGEDKLYKQIQRLMKSKRYNQELDALRFHRSRHEGISEDRINLDVMKLPVNREITRLVNAAQKRAEARLAIEEPHIANQILLQRSANQRMQAGDVEGAIDIQNQGEEERTLLNMAK